MKVLVTGGAGYLGSLLVPQLLANGHAVTVLDSFRYGQALALARCVAHPKLEVVRGDVRDTKLVDSLAHGADAVIPLAALVGAPLCERFPDEARAVNETAVYELVRGLSRDQLIVFPNTNSGYGVGSDAPCDEDSPLRPLSVYGQTKCIAEAMVLAHERSTVFRLATVFGASPRMRTDLLVNDLTLRAIRDRAVLLYEGHHRRNFVHLRDVIEAFSWALLTWHQQGKPPSGQRVFNLGNDAANVTKRELCEVIKRHVPDLTVVEAPLAVDPDRRDYLVSNARLAAAGFRAERTLDDGITELLKLYRGFNAHEHGNV